jgi:hypothetical protein
MTQAEAGIRGTKAVPLFGRLIYELISGHTPSVRANERLSPLGLLNEAGNQTLWKACASTGEVSPFRNCEEFWRMFKQDASDRVRPTSAVPPSKPQPPVVESPKAAEPGLLKPREEKVEKSATPPVSGESGGKGPSKNIIALLAIAAVLMIVGLSYIVTRQSPLPTPTPEPPSTSPSVAAITTPIPVPTSSATSGYHYSPDAEANGITTPIPVPTSSATSGYHYSPDAEANGITTPIPVPTSATSGYHYSPDAEANGITREKRLSPQQAPKRSRLPLSPRTNQGSPKTTP